MWGHPSGVKGAATDSTSPCKSILIREEVIVVWPPTTQHSTVYTCHWRAQPTEWQRNMSPWYTHNKLGSLVLVDQGQVGGCCWWCWIAAVDKLLFIVQIGLADVPGPLLLRVWLVPARPQSSKRYSRRYTAYYQRFSFTARYVSLVTPRFSTAIRDECGLRRFSMVPFYFMTWVK